MDYSFSHAAVYLQVLRTPTDDVIAQQHIRKSGPVHLGRSLNKSWKLNLMWKITATPSQQA